MCTVVCRWDPDAAWPLQILALRDERRGRDFDPPGEWWPSAPNVVGGRDRQAGGSWCVSNVSTGVTAVVLNRPERREAEPGGSSRGVLPLAAITHGPGWPDHVAVAPMASFNLVLIAPESMQWWSFDGTSLHRFVLTPGCYLFKPTGLKDDGVDPALLSGRAQLTDPAAPTEQVWGDWLTPLRAAAVTDDGTGLLIERTLDDGGIYETVFGQFIAARPDQLRLDYLLRPAAGGEWTQRLRSGRENAPSS